ncbi:hypothetical protein LN050_03755 [Comamonadaceae bacterium M7527]|nr:hypothetical protein LN050_03755 [Comamonadaceae bacterium M7527]
MAKGQQKTNKEAKKPKKSAGADKALSLGTSSEPMRAPITTSVAPKGKAKNKPAF